MSRQKREAGRPQSRVRNYIAPIVIDGLQKPPASVILLGICRRASSAFDVEWQNIFSYELQAAFQSELDRN